MDNECPKQPDAPQIAPDRHNLGFPPKPDHPSWVRAGLSSADEVSAFPSEAVDGLTRDLAAMDELNVRACSPGDLRAVLAWIGTYVPRPVEVSEELVEVDGISILSLRGGAEIERLDMIRANGRPFGGRGCLWAGRGAVLHGGRGNGRWRRSHAARKGDRRNPQQGRQLVSYLAAHIAALEALSQAYLEQAALKTEGPHAHVLALHASAHRTAAETLKAQAARLAAKLTGRVCPRCVEPIAEGDTRCPCCLDSVRA